MRAKLNINSMEALFELYSDIVYSIDDLMTEVYLQEESKEFKEYVSKEKLLRLHVFEVCMKITSHLEDVDSELVIEELYEELKRNDKRLEEEGRFFGVVDLYRLPLDPFEYDITALIDFEETAHSILNSYRNTKKVK
ncbi:MAG: hypothetical protein LRY26_00845 [Bacilli bacterium]|nr:hypothetical protein [Bacilli bacterium]